MKKKVVSALSGLALLVSNACAKIDYTKVETIVSNKISAINEQCEDKKYDNNLACAKDSIKEAYKSVYPIVRLDFNKGDAEPEYGEGSGLLLEGGYVLTAYHIIEPEDKNKMTVSYIMINDNPYRLEKIVGDEATDFMILKVAEDAPGANPYKLGIGDSDKIAVGNAAYLVGNSYGFGINAREGIISQIGFNPGQKSFDEDFAISCGGNTGDSGGPVFALMDGKLELVGVMVTVVPRANDLAYARSINTILKKLKGIAPNMDLPLKR